MPDLLPFMHVSAKGWRWTGQPDDARPGTFTVTAPGQLAAREYTVTRCPACAVFGKTRWTASSSGSSRELAHADTVDAVIQEIEDDLARRAEAAASFRPNKPHTPRSPAAVKAA